METLDGDIKCDPEDRIVDRLSAREVKDKMLDKTIADSFPSSDPLSTIPDPCEDSFCSGLERQRRAADPTKE